MPDLIQSVEAFPLTLPREVPYLGAIEPGVRITSNGLFVRPGNGTVYSLHEHCVLVKVTTNSGLVGWGEAVAVVAPTIVATVIRDLVGPLVVGRDPEHVVAIYHDLYDALRVRGFFGGFYHDALAALDIALWDAKGKLLGRPIHSLLGGARLERLPCYVSGLPESTLASRVSLALAWQGRGFNAFKFAAAVSHEGIVEEMRALRGALGPSARILVDLHWKFTPGHAIKLITELERHDLHVAEAPLRPEDVGGLARVARAVRTPVAIGEELRTVHEFRPRFEAGAMDVIQPEMGRTGLTAFWQIGQLAHAWNCEIMPHASIGIGVFQAASLHASAALTGFTLHEYQHSIFDKNLALITGDMRCEAGFFHLPTGPGLGVEPRSEALELATRF